MILCLLCVSAVAASASDDFVTLNNGLKMPVASFGLQVVDDDTAKTQVVQALGVGVRNLFASVLADNQPGVGEGIKAAGVKRSDLFVCGSANTGDCSSADECDTNLKDLQLDYVDMIMLDYPSSSCDNIKGQWKAFEEMLAAKKTKSVAVSNFSPDQLDCLVGKNSTTPTLNQMPYSVGHGTDTVVADNAKRNIIVQAYSPLGSGSLVSDTDCAAIGKKYKKSAAQVALKWILQHNATFSTNCDQKNYMQEDIELFDFTLSAADMKTLDAKSVAANGNKWH